jgi:hypothetical protein
VKLQKPGGPHFRKFWEKITKAAVSSQAFMTAFLKWNNLSEGSDILELQEIDWGFQKI